LERQLGDQRIEDVEGVVQCRGLEDAGEGQQVATRQSKRRSIVESKDIL
jgi:hypothetical protein